MATNSRDQAPYQPHPKASRRRKSAITAAKAILGLDLYPPHKRRLLSVCVWKITEADGKYRTRFKTQEALHSERCDLTHEHVYRRKRLITALLQAPANADIILARAIACTVTRQEHIRLCKQDRARPDLDGWERYRRSRITVIDTLTQRSYGFHEDEGRYQKCG
jgi:hypothetical protein